MLMVRCAECRLALLQIVELMPFQIPDQCLDLGNPKSAPNTGIFGIAEGTSNVFSALITSPTPILSFATSSLHHYADATYHDER